jgi:protein involved in polysaccharide export with SLBB domain
MVLAGLMGRCCYLCAAILAAVVCFGVRVQAQQTGVQTGIQSPIQSPIQNPYSNTDPKVETSKQTNERIKTLSMGVRTQEREYRIGAGDVVVINVFDVPELTREARVSQAGTLSMPLVPVRLQIAGLTEVQAEQKIAEVLEANGLVSHPEVSVTVKEHRSRPITIVGAVNRPMVYEADRTVTVLEVLAEAGGITADASDTVIISRGKSPVYPETQTAGGVSQSVPGAAESQNAEPPELDSSGNPVSTAAATAVPQENPTSAQPVPAFPSSADMPQQIPPLADTTTPMPADTTANSGSIITLNLNQLFEQGNMHDNVVLQAGDVVTVPHAGIVYVLGAVNRPGGFVVNNDRSQFTTLKVLALAGGMTNIAKKDHAVLIRKDSQGKATETEVDLKKILARESEDVQLRASDLLYIPDSHTRQILVKALEFGLALGSSVAIFRLAYH